MQKQTSSTIGIAVVALIVLGMMAFGFFSIFFISIITNSDLQQQQQQSADQQEMVIPFKDLYLKIADKYPSVPWNVLAAVHRLSPEYSKHMQAWNNFSGSCGFSPMVANKLRFKYASTPVTEFLKTKTLSAICKYSKENNIDPILTAAIIQAESSWIIDNGSDAGAQGLMQVMPFNFEKGENHFDVDTNIMRGTQVYKSCLKLHPDETIALGCYNGGPGAVSNNQLPSADVNPETHNYPGRVHAAYAEISKYSTPAFPENNSDNEKDKNKNKVTTADVEKWLDNKAKQLADLTRIQSDETKGSKTCRDKVQKMNLTMATGLACAVYMQAPDEYQKSDEAQFDYVKNVDSTANELLMGSGGVLFNGGSGFGGKIIAAAKRWEGTPYVYGGGGKDGPTPGGGFDCSSLVLYSVYQASGGKLTLPRVADDQANSKQGQVTVSRMLGASVNFNLLQPGDVIYFDNMPDKPGYDHVGIYVGNRQMIAAPKTGDVVKVQPLTDSYWQTKSWLVKRYG
ncbi:C40 family peptidase [Shimazuella sp. AN120528]|uniref:C40 family peptidase n=1 Tax=Shimazuella soli TaxID=1892854 RepID=UPI001F0DF31B|nr:C40 family peptidase [Shimazuella soli]MCH5585660.1 C40 family peptidase [Shimazuella soli]